MTTNKIFSFDLQMFTSNGYAIEGISNGGENENTAALKITTLDFSTVASGTQGSSSNPYSLVADGSGTDTVAASSTQWIKIGSTSTGELVIGGASQTIKGGTANTMIALKGGSALAWTGLNGTAGLSLASGTFDQTIGGSVIDIDTNNNAELTLKGDGSKLTMAGVSSGQVIFGNVKQNWVINAGASVGLTDKGTVTAGTANATLNSGGGSSYLDFTLGTGGDLTFSTASLEDTVSLKADSMVINGLSALNGASLAKSADSSYGLGIGTAGGNVSLNASRFDIAALASVVITGTGTTAYVSKISALNKGGNWVLGKDASAATLGNNAWAFSAANATLTADSSNGDTATTVALASGTATLTNTAGISQALNMNGKVDWTFAEAGSASATQVVFDNSGNITNLTGAAAVTFAESQTGGATVASFATKTGDSLKLAVGGTATVDANNYINAVGANGLAGNSDWKVTGKSAVYGESATGATYQDWSLAKAGAVLSTDSLGAITSVSGLTGNATVEHGYNESNFAINVMSKNWTLAGDTNSVAAFDSVGNASIGAAAGTAVTGDASAAVTLAGDMSNGVVINGISASVSADQNVAFGLEAAGTGEGIASITGVDANTSIRVAGDNEFIVGAGKATYTVASENTADSITNFYYNNDSGRIEVQLTAGDAYTVDGGKALFTFNSSSADADNSSMATATVVTINGSAVSLKAGTESAVSIESAAGDDITAVTINSGDAIYTGDDKKFAVVVTPEGKGDSINVITVNDVQISVDGNYLTDNSTITVDQSGSTPMVTITGGLATVDGSYSLTSGVYKIGNNAAETIASGDTPGYVTLSGGKATVQNASVKEATEAEASKWSSLESAAASVTVGAYEAFKFASNRSSLSETVANFANGSATVTPTNSQGTTGFNIYGNDALSSADLTSVTLEAFSSATDPIDIEANEGSKVANAVVDFSNSNSLHQVIIGASSSVTANHTVLGGGKGDTIMFGANATGSNVAKAGSGAAYLVNKSTSSKISSLIGGDGDDTIVGAANDYVEGGSGADRFNDSAAYLINDYNAATDGDIIVASKLSSLGVTDLAQLDINGNVIAVNGGSKMTLGADYDDTNSMAAIIAGVDGSTTNAKYVAWASAYGSTVDASSRTRGSIIIGSHNDAGDLLQGGSGKDTISAGGNDSVLSGEGADYITLKAADTSNGELGAMVQLSAGKNTIDGWTQGFDNEAGANILYREAGSEGLSFKTSGNKLTVSESGSSVTFGDTIDDTFNFLVGTPTGDLDKVTFIKSGGEAIVSSNDEIADVYYGEKKGSLTFGESVSTAMFISLGSDQYNNINYLASYSGAEATIAGDSGNTKETVVAAGSLEDGAHKIVSLGGGNDLIISGGTSTISSLQTAGNTFYFSAGDGKDTIQSFSFYQGSEADPDLEQADLLSVGNDLGTWISNIGGDYTKAFKGTGSKVEISTSTSDKVILSGAGTNDIFRIKFNDTNVYEAKVGNTSSTNIFAYDDYTDYYFGNSSRNKDTIVAAGEDQSVGIWLSSAFGINDPNGKTYSGISDINASSLTGSTATLVGAQGRSSTLHGAGNNSSTSLWGGQGGNNVLIGGAGQDTFVLFTGYSNNDTISNIGSDDMVWLANVTTNDIDWTKMTIDNNFGISSSKIEVYLTDGSKLTVASPTTSTTFQLADGSQYAAVNRGSNSGWNPVA